MSNDLTESVQIVPVAAPVKYKQASESIKAKIFNEFVYFYAAPSHEKAVMFGIEVDPKTKKFKKIPTYEDFAKKHGVHRNTLLKWRNRDDFLAQVNSMRKQNGLQHVPDVLDALRRRCIRYGIAADVEAYLAYYTGYDRKRPEKDHAEPFTIDDIRALLAPLPKAEQDQFYGIINQIIQRADVLRGATEVPGPESGIAAANQG